MIWGSLNFPSKIKAIGTVSDMGPPQFSKLPSKIKAIGTVSDMGLPQFSKLPSKIKAFAMGTSQ